MQSSRYIILAIAAFAMGVDASISVAGVLIDDFTSATPGGDAIDLVGPSSASASFTSASAIGGTRDVFFEQDYPGDSSLAFLDTPVLASGISVSLVVSNPSSLDPSNSSSWSITYDAAGAGLGVDLSTAGDALVVEWIPDHVAFGNDTVIGFTFTDGSAATYSSIVTWSAPTDIFQNIDREVFSTSFSMSEFANQGIDLTDIDSIVFFGETDLAGDYQFGSIRIGSTDIPTDVPEPSTVFLLGLGAVAWILLFRARRCRSGPRRFPV